MSVLTTMTITDAELAARRLEIVTNLLEKTKREKNALSEQVVLLERTNNDLSQYAETFKLDEKVEAANIEKAQQEAVATDFDSINLDDLVSAEDFASGMPDNGMIDIDIIG